MRLWPGKHEPVPFGVVDLVTYSCGDEEANGDEHGSGLTDDFRGAVKDGDLAGGGGDVVGEEGFADGAGGQDALVHEAVEVGGGAGAFLV